MMSSDAPKYIRFPHHFPRRQRRHHRLLAADGSDARRRLFRPHVRTQKFVGEARARDGVVTLFIRHTSASLTIKENADPTVLVDLTTALNRLAPENAGWRHDTEGPDDMPAHIKTMLTATSLQVPVLQGVPALGTWQAIYLVEHRARPHRREVVLQFIGSVD
jgi:secondary thiamine-phosphate synthase enzyme